MTKPTTLAEVVVAAAEAFAAATGQDLAGVGRRHAGDSRLFTGIKASGAVTPDVYADAMSWFSAFWPEGAAWPAGVPRHEPSGLHKREAEDLRAQGPK